MGHRANYIEGSGGFHTIGDDRLMRGRVFGRCRRNGFTDLSGLGVRLVLPRDTRCGGRMLLMDLLDEPVASGRAVKALSLSKGSHIYRARFSVPDTRLADLFSGSEPA